MNLFSSNRVDPADEGDAREKEERARPRGYQFKRALEVLTFPGVVLHEFSHQFAVEVLDYEVENVDYSGQVDHEMPTTVIDAVIVSIAPLVVNATFAVALFFAQFKSVPHEFSASSVSSPMDVIVGFVVFTLLFRAIPSLQDIRNIFVVARLRISWYRVDKLLIALPLLLVFAPLYVTLRILRYFGARVVIDGVFTVTVLLYLFGVFS